MKRFAELLDRLVYTPSRNDKLRLLADYLRATPDPDRGWALAALTDGLLFRLPIRRILGEMIEARIDPVLFGLSRDYVGDTAETIALIWPDPRRRRRPPRLDEVVQELKRAMPREVPGLCRIARQARCQRALCAAQVPDRRAAGRRFGAARQDRACRNRRTRRAEIEEVWHGIAPPYAELFAWLDGAGRRPDHRRRTASFRPFMLAHPIEEELARSDAEGLRRRMEVGRHPRPGGARRRRAALFLAHRRRDFRRLPRSRRRRSRPGGVLDGDCW